MEENNQEPIRRDGFQVQRGDTLIENPTVQSTETEAETKYLKNAVGGQKLSKKTLLMFAGVAVLAALPIYYGYSYWKSGGENKKKQQESGTLKYDAAPNSIGRSQDSLPPREDEIKEDVKETTNETSTEPPPNEQAPETTNATTVNTNQPPPAPTAPPVDEVAQRRLSSPIETNGAKEAKAKAKVGLVNQTTTLMKGTRIACVLESAIQSELDGFTSCVVRDDVYSGNAKTLLIEKGSRITGYYSGDVKNGANRIQIVWDRIITPFDVSIALNSPTTDRLGASGAVGDVDNRWGLRIGSALLVSLIGDSLELLADDENSGSNNVYVEGETRDTVQNLAEQILEKNIDLPPIISIKNGETIMIYVVDDIDFSGVYKTVKPLN